MKALEQLRPGAQDSEVAKRATRRVRRASRNGGADGLILGATMNAAGGRSLTTAMSGRADARVAIEAAVTGLGYELVDVERAARGLLRVTIDRVPGRTYAAGPGEAVTVDDCEAVTRQLQYALEVDGVDYERLEVSSPGLDRPLRNEADGLRFEGHEVALTLKQPFEGRKNFRGVLGRADGGWQLVFDEGRGEQVLGFAWHEVRDARLVPQLDFKGRRGAGQAGRSGSGRAPRAPRGDPAAAGPSGRPQGPQRDGEKDGGQER